MTYRTHACPACGASGWTTYPALVAPFVAEHALQGTSRSAIPATRLAECNECGLRFFEDRLTDSEVARLYDGYRGDRYYETRHRHEPWYTRAANDGIGDDLERRKTIERFLRRKVTHVGAILDFGGDRGQYIPQGIADENFVHDISGVAPEPGVMALATEKELEGRSFDLVLLCHVLEHASEPRALLEKIAPLLRDRDSYLYVEVPYERAKLSFVGRGNGYARWLETLAKVRPALTAIDFYSTVFRRKLDVVPPLGLLKLHEHINYFAEDSLRAVLEAAGYEVAVVDREVIGSTLGATPVVCALARRRA